MTKKFGELSRSEQLALFSAWLDGATIESHSSIGWRDSSLPKWGKNSVYRVREPSKPSANWDHVNPDYDYLAEDSDGRGFFYNSHPRLNPNGGWYSPTIQYEVIFAKGFASYVPGECNWKDSLVMRPGVSSSSESSNKKSE